MRNRAFGLLAAVVGLAGAGGCVAYVPEHPTWKDDIHPLMFARCIRCHQETSRGDPTVTTAAYRLQRGITFDYPTLADIPLDVLMGWKTTIPFYVEAPDKPLPSSRMPPAPAARLQDWEVETFKRWLDNPLP